MSLDSQIVGDALLAIGPIIAAVIAGRAVRYGRHNGDKLDSNTDKLDRVLTQTNGEMDVKIRKAFAQVLREHPRLVGHLLDEELHDLLDAIFRAANDEGN